MDVFIELIIWIIRALAGEQKPKQSPLPPGARRSQPPLQQAVEDRAARRIEQRARPAITSVAQDPAYDDGGWRNAVLVVGVIVLIALAVAWYVYTRGLPAG